MTQKHFQKQFSSNKNIFHKFGIRDFHYFGWLSYADIDKIDYRHLINLLSFQKYFCSCLPEVQSVRAVTPQQQTLKFEP